MSRKTRNIVILAAVAVLAGLWIWRYTAINAYYHGIAGEEERQKYAIGDIVPMSGSKKGYSIRVDGFEIVEYEDIDPDAFAQSDTFRTGADGRIGLLTITIFNVDSEADGVALNSLVIRGEDSVLNVDWELLTALNPVLGGFYGTSLSPGTEYSFVVPFMLLQRYLPGAWNHLERYPLYLNLSTSVDIRLQ